MLPPAFNFHDWENLMKKFVYAGLFAVTLATPAFAQSKFAVSSPEDPLHRRTIAICAALLVGVHAYATRGSLPAKR
jgi:hypothetical protein